MNNKPNVPEEVIPGKSYSFRVDMKVNGWLLVAMLTAGAGDFWLSRHQDYPLALRLLITLIPLPVSLLWALSIARWIRSMDELHRRLTVEACLFATACTLFLIMAWQRLNDTGIFRVTFQPTRAQIASVNFAEYALVIGLVYFFYFLGHAIFNRRYK